jgi:CRP/FNR family cyclic AMP-dependent transcriptional regulator
LFPPYYWHFDARALAPTKAIFFYGTRLRTQCEEDHDFGYELIRRMAAVVIMRLQAARGQMADSRRKVDLGVGI